MTIRRKVIMLELPARSIARQNGRIKVFQTPGLTGYGHANCSAHSVSGPSDPIRGCQRNERKLF
jgi:hypothetical protein